MPEYFKLRPDLVIRPQNVGGQTVYVVKDPATGRFFNLREPEYFLISRMDGKTAVEAAVVAFAARFEMQLPPGAAEAFFRKMQRLCLFEGIYAEAAIAREYFFSNGGRLLCVMESPLDKRYNPLRKFAIAVKND